MKKFRFPNGTVVTGRIVGKGRRVRVQYTVPGNRGKTCKRFFPFSLAEELSEA